MLFDISPQTLKFSESVELKIKDAFSARDRIKAFNFSKVLKAMQDNQLSDRHFGWQTGYGYDDSGREITEAIFRDVFKAEDALVRTQIVNGTHALSIGLNAILRPGDQMLAITGTPYDTLHETIGINKKNGSSLIELGVLYDAVNLLSSGDIDIERAKEKINSKTKLIYIQRSSGYSFRASLTLNAISQAITELKKIKPDLLFMVDNCYGEFIEEKEPIEIGANLIAGSLIKNPGGGLALSGGYLAGDQWIIERCAHKLTTPGIGKECGLTFGQTRTMLQGLFLAPEIVNNALKSAIFAAKLFEDAGYEVAPKWQNNRSDIIQCIKLGDKDKVIAFCKAIQSASPVDAFVTPNPWAMPGYSDEVIMAAGAFVQGSSIELSADAPIREPYAVYLQGGLLYEHGKLGALLAYEAIKNIK